MLKPRVSRAYWDEADINLTLTEFNIVRLLASNVGNHVTYRAVYDCMHHVGFIAGSGENGYRTNVRSSIKRIRNKFRLVDPEFAEIENYPSFGYRWGKPKAPPRALAGRRAPPRRLAHPQAGRPDRHLHRTAHRPLQPVRERRPADARSRDARHPGPQQADRPCPGAGRCAIDQSQVAR